MYQHEAISKAGGAYSSHLARRIRPDNGTGLDEIVGRARLRENYADTMQAFAEVVEVGKIIEEQNHPHPDTLRGLIPELNELRLTAIFLRKEINRGRYRNLKTALPFIEKYVAMAMQYAQSRGLLPKPNPDSYRLRQMREWLKTRQDDSQTRQVLAWLGSSA